MGVSTEGDLYAWGLNFKGQLGVGDFENRATPVLVDSFCGNNISQVPPGAGNSAANQTKKYLV